MKERIMRAGPSVLDPHTNQPVPAQSPFVFYRAKWLGENQSGVRPIGDKVLLLPDFIGKKTPKGIEIPEERIDREDQAITTGMLIAVGDGAFAWNSDRVTPFVGRKPQAGDRVTFEKYTGQIQRGADGVLYRLLDDRCIGAIIEAKEEKANGSH